MAMMTVPLDVQSLQQPRPSQTETDALPALSNPPPPGPKYTNETSSKQTRYCSAPLDYPLAQRPLPISDAGAGSAAAGAIAGDLELRQLQVTIRHGDRSAIHELPNAYEQKWKCQPFSEEIQRKWEGVSR